MNSDSCRDRISRTQLLVLVDGCDSVADLTHLSDALAAAGVGAIQLRDKARSDRELLERALALRQATLGSSTLLLINDRPDLAVLSGADGVHVGQEDLPIDAVRRIVGPDRLIGVSTHSFEQARQAVREGADLIGIGPLFPSRTKGFSRFLEIDVLRQVAEEIGIPVFAIGGIDAARLPEVMAMGIRRVAVGSAITARRDPGPAAAEMVAILQTGDRKPGGHPGAN